MLRATDPRVQVSEKVLQVFRRPPDDSESVARDMSPIHLQSDMAHMCAYHRYADVC